MNVDSESWKICTHSAGECTARQLVDVTVPADESLVRQLVYVYSVYL